MLLCSLCDLRRDIENARAIERQPQPEKFDLILGGKGNQARRPKNGQNVGQVVRATGNHCRSRRRPRHCHDLAGGSLVLHDALQVCVHADLHAETRGKPGNEIPVRNELIEREVKAGYEPDQPEINRKQDC